MMRGCDAGGAWLAGEERTPGSSVAAPTAAKPLMNPRRPVRLPAATRSPDHARRRMPRGSVRQFLEVVIDDVWLGKILGVLDELGERHPPAAIRQIKEEEVLLEHGVGAVG